MCGKWKDTDLCKQRFLGVEPSVNWKDKESTQETEICSFKD